MTLEIAVVVVLVAVAAMTIGFWQVRRVDRQHAQASEILARNIQQQDREAELLARWEVLITRLEALIDRVERRP